MIRILAKESLCYLAVVLIVQSYAIYARSLKLTFNTMLFCRATFVTSLATLIKGEYVVRQSKMGMTLTEQKTFV